MDKDADFLMVLTHPLEFAAPGVFAGWLTVPAGGVFDSVSSGRGAGRAVLGEARMRGRAPSTTGFTPQARPST